MALPFFLICISNGVVKREKNITAIPANLQWRFFIIIVIIVVIMCFGKQNSQGCQASDKFVFL